MPYLNLGRDALGTLRSMCRRSGLERARQEPSGKRLMTADGPRLPLQSFFAGLAEYTFETRLGLADPPLVDYLAEMLTRFVRYDALYPIRDPRGRRVQEVAEMVLEAEARKGSARRDLHRHIGDFTLYWTGVYPEALNHLRDKRTKDYFVDYCAQGKRAYFIASTMDSETDEAQRGVLERLSHQFEMCAYGLNEVRREWERRDGDGDSWRLLILN